jgi:hypothetical protein
MIDHSLEIDNCSFPTSQHEIVHESSSMLGALIARDKRPQWILYTQLLYEIEIEGIKFKFNSRMLTTGAEYLRTSVLHGDIVLRYNPTNFSEYLFWRRSTMQELY